MNDLLKELRKSGIRVNVTNNDLKLKVPKGFAQTELIDKVKENKLDLIRHISNLKHRNKFLDIKPAPAKADYVLSSAQKRLYFTYAFNPDSTAYNMPGCYRINGKLDTSRLETSIIRLVERHESLRTQFYLKNDIPVQRIVDESHFKMAYYQGTVQELDKVFSNFIRPFKLDEDYPFRVGLMDLGSDEHVLFFDMHHIISDGISQNVLIEDFQYIYQGIELPKLGLQYKDYAEWQQSDEQLETIGHHKTYWLDQFAQDLEVLDLPLDYMRPKVSSNKGGNFSFDLDTLETKKLRNMAQQEGVTTFMLLMSIYKVFLSKITNQEDIVVGTPTSGRNHPDLESIVGMFVNTLAIRSWPKGEIKFNKFLTEIKETTLLAFDHQLYPYDELVDELGVERDTARNPLFDVTFSYFNESENTPEEELPVLMEAYEAQGLDDTAKFDLGLTAVEHLDHFSLNFTYGTDLFELSTIQRFVRFFRKIVNCVLFDKEILLKEVSVLDDDDVNRLVNLTNDTKTSFPKHKTIAQLFREQVARTPDAIAVDDGTDSGKGNGPILKGAFIPETTPAI